MLRNYYILLLTLVLYGCPAYDPPSGVLTIQNYTDSAIYVYSTCANQLELSPKLELFPAYSIEKDQMGNDIYEIVSPQYRINAYTFGEMDGYGSENNRHIPCGEKLNLFFISETVMRKHTWKEIVESKMYLKKTRLTQKGLDSLDWTIVYSKGD